MKKRILNRFWFLFGLIYFASANASEPGITVVEVPTLPNERQVLSSIESINPDLVEAAFAFPGNFDPDKQYPILITQVTVDRYRPNIDDMEAYRETALKNGYVVMTAQSKPWPATSDDDTRQHRYIALRAGLRWLARRYPASRHWPLAFAGFSGGAKMIQPLAGVMLMEQRRVIGLFMGGCNDDSTKQILKIYPRVADAYLDIAFFLSSGSYDKVATPRHMRRVAKRMERAGAKKVHLSRYGGDHELDTDQLDKALKWFLEQEANRRQFEAKSLQSTSE